MAFRIELPSAKADGFLIHRPQPHITRSYTISKGVNSRSPYGMVTKRYWLSNFPLLSYKCFLNI